MITVETALKYVEGRTSKAIEEMAFARISGSESIPVGLGGFEERPEDLIIQLLSSQDLDSGIRSAIIVSLRSVFGKVMEGDLTSDGEGAVREMAKRLCRVVDIAQPGELRSRTNALLRFVMDEASIPKDVMTAITRAAMAYLEEGEKREWPLWLSVCENRDTAAYGVRALVRIDHWSNRIDQALANLWIRRMEDGWTVDVAHLLRIVARARGSERVVANVLRRVCEEGAGASSVRDRRLKIRAELARRSWSRPWVSSFLETLSERPATCDNLNTFKGASGISLAEVSELMDEDFFYYVIKTEIRDFDLRQDINKLLDESPVEFYRKNQAHGTMSKELKYA